MSNQNGSRRVEWKRARIAVNRFMTTAETDVLRLAQFKKNIVDVSTLVALSTYKFTAKVKLSIEFL